MNKLAHVVNVVLALSIAGGCRVDPPIYYTPLPGGLEHVSNGGQLGFIGLPTKGGGWIPVYPNEEDWYCNEFAILETNVIGIEIVLSLIHI